MAINIKVDQSRISNLVTVDQYLSLLDGEVKTMVEVLSMFVVGDDGEYLKSKDGRKLIGQLTLDELKEAIGSFTGRIDDAIVPPSSGAA